MKRFKVISGLVLAMALGSLLSLGIVSANSPPPATYVAAIGMTGQGANISSTPIAQQVNPVIFALGGMYRASCYVIETTADAASSTLPACNVIYTDSDTGNSHTAALTATSTANTVDTVGASVATVPLGLIHVKASTAINFSTSSYASGTSGVMKYAVHFRLEFIGQ